MLRGLKMTHKEQENGMITRKTAMTLKPGTILQHVKKLGTDNKPLRISVTGKCKVYKTSKTEFSLPVKYGALQLFHITLSNASQWSVS